MSRYPAQIRPGTRAFIDPRLTAKLVPLGFMPEPSSEHVSKPRFTGGAVAFDPNLSVRLRPAAPGGPCGVDVILSPDTLSTVYRDVLTEATDPTTFIDIVTVPAGKRVFYTVDGTDPSESNGFVLDTGSNSRIATTHPIVVKAIAIDGECRSEIKTGVYSYYAPRPLREIRRWNSGVRTADEISDDAVAYEAADTPTDVRCFLCADYNRFSGYDFSPFLTVADSTGLDGFLYSTTGDPDTFVDGSIPGVQLLDSPLTFYAQAHASDLARYPWAFIIDEFPVQGFLHPDLMPTDSQSEFVCNVSTRDVTLVDDVTPNARLPVDALMYYRTDDDGTDLVTPDDSEYTAPFSVSWPPDKYQRVAFSFGKDGWFPTAVDFINVGENRIDLGDITIPFTDPFDVVHTDTGYIDNFGGGGFRTAGDSVLCSEELRNRSSYATFFFESGADTGTWRFKAASDDVPTSFASKAIEVRLYSADGATGERGVSGFNTLLASGTDIEIGGSLVYVDYAITIPGIYLLEVVFDPSTTDTIRVQVIAEKI